MGAKKGEKRRKNGFFLWINQNETMDTKEEVKKIINDKLGFPSFRKGKNWKGYKVYIPEGNGNDVRYIGLPIIVLCKKDRVRLCTGKEAREYLDFESGNADKIK